jgi:hypothetical protein
MESLTISSSENVTIAGVVRSPASFATTSDLPSLHTATHAFVRPTCKPKKADIATREKYINIQMNIRVSLGS